VNQVSGTGQLQASIQKALGIKDNHGIRIGGALVADTNSLFSGGIPNVQRWTSNGLFLLNATVDTQKLIGWKGGLFGAEFLQFNGQNTNAQAGSIQGYNSLPGPPPLNRSELYQLWFRQALFEDKFFIRIGKSVPTIDFNNVIKPVSLKEDKLFIPAVTSLIYTPIFVNSSMLGILPGYYNSAYGITLNFTPIRRWYASYGVYDGNLAQGKQTGLTGPTFNGSYLHIGETGLAWLFGKFNKPGNIGLGLWHQSGLVQNGNLSEGGTTGYYLFGTQRLWYRHPSVDTSGISMFYQFGDNSSHVLSMTKYIGLGFTAFGLMPRRPNDSAGIGTAFSWLNKAIYSRRTEQIIQAYYQAKIISSIYLEPVLSYIPTPGASPQLNPSWAGTLRLVALF